MRDVVIIGAGPAGIAAAIYAKRAELDLVLIEGGLMGGGQIAETMEVENYPGIFPIGGFELASKFVEHATSLGIETTEAKVTGIEEIGNGKRVILEDGSHIETKTVIICTGATHKKLEVEGEEELLGAGVSYCATCDGAFFKGKTVCVVGGGDVAVGDALFLSRICKKVYVIHRRNAFRAASSLVTKMKETDNIEFVMDSVVEKINGVDHVESVTLLNVATDEKSYLATDGVFIAVGMSPDTGLYKDVVKTDKNGYIVAEEDGITSDPRIFVAGDIRTKKLRQVVTAASDGANAATSAIEYITELG